MRRALGVSIALACLLASGPASADPPFPGTVTPGELRGITLNNGDPWTLGYWEYLPSSYENAPAGTEWPLVVFLAGIGEFADPSDCPAGADTCTNTDCQGDNTGLCRNLQWGPQDLMEADNWDDTTRDFIFVSPQNNAPQFTQTEFDVDELDAFFQYIVDNYPVDTRRMYLTGMSQGGRAVLQYTQQHPRRFTAVAPLPGGAVDQDVTCYFEDTALWAFHGENDDNGALGMGVFDPCWMATRVDMYRNPGNYAQFPACAERAMGPLAEGRITMFDGVGHSAWIQSIDPLGSGFVTSSWTTPQNCNMTFTYREYTAANDPDGVYSWFLSLDRPEISVSDVMVDYDVGTAMIPATVEDDDNVMWTWTQVSGPAATLMNDDTDTLSVVMPTAETTYGFEVMVLDDDNQWDVAQVSLTVGPEPVGGTSSGGEGSTSAGSTGGDASTGGASDGSTGGDSSGTSDSGSASGSSGASASGGSDSGSASATGASGSASDTAATGDTAGSASGGTDADSGTDSGSGGGADDDDSGCRIGGRRSTPSAWALLLLTLGVVRRRRA